MSSGFDPKAYLQESEAPMMGGFDPKAYLAEGHHGMDVIDTGGVGQAALEHFGNAASMGYLPQLQAITEKLTPNPGAAVDAKLRAQGFKIDQPEEGYTASRDANIARLAKQGEEFPVASSLGTIGGIIAGGAATGAALKGLSLGSTANELSQAAKAAKTAGNAKSATGLAAAAGATRIAGGATTGATMGAIANPGDTEGEIDPFQLGTRVDNAKVGALTGGAISTAVEAVPAALSGIKYAGKKVSSALSGLTDDVISRYSAKTDQINEMIKKSGGDMSEAADQVRQQAQSAIRSTRAQYASQIGKALESAPKDPIAEVNPILEQLNKVKSRLNPNLQSEAVTQLDDIITRVTKEAEANGGKVSIQQLNQITDFLQGRAKSAYMSGGQIFQNAKEAAQAAKGAAAVSRKMLNSLSPEIAEANNKLAYLHSLEDRLNPNLIKPGAPDSALMAAGAGSNPRNERVLQAVGEASGFPLLEKAKDLATAKQFANPSLLPNYSTGKSVAGLAIAAGAGHLAGPMGYAVGALASPAAIKAGINVANTAGKIAAPLTKAVANNSQALGSVAQRVGNAVVSPAQNQAAPGGPAIDQETLGIFKSNPDLIDSITDPALKKSIQKQINVDRAPSAGSKDTPAKGPDSWAQRGIQNLRLDQDTAERLLQTPKGKQLLIQASDLKPGSKAMQNLTTQIQKGFGNKK